MFAAYLAAFAFGVVLIGAQIVMGGKDLDSEADGLDVDKDIDFDKDLDFDKDIDFDKDLEFELDADTDFDGDLDADADADLDADADAELEGEGDFAKELAHDAGEAGASLIFNPFLSLRFWTYFLASFGMVGAVLHLLGLDLIVHAPVASFTGFGIGYGAAWAFKALKRNPVHTEMRTDRMVGAEATAVLQIAPGKTGKIRLTMGGSDLELLATTREGTIKRGAHVLVVRVVDGVAEVTHLPRLEDLSAEERALARRRAALAARKKSTS